MIYFVECADRVKIGFSERPKLRFVKIAADCPFHCTLLGVMPGDVEVEAGLHRKFSSLRVRGEWFLHKGELASFIKANAGKPPSSKPEPTTALGRFLHSKSISSAAFAASINVAPSTITRIIRGERTPRIDLIAKIKVATRGKVKAEDFMEQVA